MNDLLGEKKELLVVGIPRSGSTLLSALIDSLEDSLCLSEPKALFIPRASTDRDAYIRKIFDSLKVYRENIINCEKIEDKRNVDGTPITNYQKRTKFLNWTRSKFQPMEGFIDTNQYSPNALIAIKHNVPFFAVLPQLIDSDLPIIGIVRNPISAILSWQETQLAVTKGFLPSAQAFWPDLNQIMNSSKNKFIGWARIHNAFCERLIHCGVRVIKYEDLVQDPKIIEAMLNRKLVRDIPVSDKNKNSVYNWKSEKKIRESLRKYAPFSCQFYPDI